MTEPEKTYNIVGILILVPSDTKLDEVLNPLAGYLAIDHRVGIKEVPLEKAQSEWADITGKPLELKKD